MLAKLHRRILQLLAAEILSNFTSDETSANAIYLEKNY
jgi:hypothetical protein